MNDTPESTPQTAPAPPAAPTPTVPPIQINMPKQRRPWLTRLLTTGLIAAVIIIAYLSMLLSAQMTGPMASEVLTEGDPEQVVAVYKVDGLINTEQAGRFRVFVRETLKNNKIKAVVIRVNSPGGAVAPSDQINAGMRQLKDAGKKVVVSMGGVAASGGYYMSVPAEFIYAEPTTITGSIGVISQMPIIVGTMERIGMEVLTLRSTQAETFKARLNPVEAPSEQAIAEHKVLLDKIQGLFMAAVDRGRTVLTTEEVESLSNGRVWLGEEAKAKKLVDEIGYLSDAVDKAADLAGLSRPHVVHYKMRKGVMEKLLGGSGPGLQVDADLLDKIQTPRVMMIWRP